MIEFYNRFKITITVAIIAVVSLIVGQMFYLSFVLSKGIENIVELYKGNIIIGNTLIVGIMLLILVGLDTLRYSMTKKSK